MRDGGVEVAMILSVLLRSEGQGSIISTVWVEITFKLSFNSLLAGPLPSCWELSGRDAFLGARSPSFPSLEKRRLFYITIFIIY